MPAIVIREEICPICGKPIGNSAFTRFSKSVEVMNPITRKCESQIVKGFQHKGCSERKSTNHTHSMNFSWKDNKRK